MKNKIIDLFCGCGGMSRGFEMAGFEPVVAIDLWTDAIKTYNHNCPTDVGMCMDIHDLTKELIKSKADLSDVVGIIGGPPCQGFSTVGKREIDDPRNQLYLEYCRIVKEVSPEFFVIENVKGLLTLNKGAVRDDIEKRFSEMGYHVTYKVLNAADYGIPQNRKRVFFVGMKKRAFEFPAPHDKILTAKDGISDLPSIETWDGESVFTCYATEPANEFQKLMRSGATTLMNHEFTLHSPQTIDVISRIPDGGSIKDLPPEFWQIRKYNKAFERMSSIRPANTVDTGHRNYFHYGEARIPTVRENARLQSFPDDFEFLGTRGSQYKQVGNAVPPLLAYAIAKEIQGQISTKKTGSVKMLNQLYIPNITNPGLSFTANTYDMLKRIHDCFEGTSESSIPYKAFQKEFSKTDPKGDSKIRMVFPIMRKAGCIFPANKRGDVVFKEGEFLTELGKQFLGGSRLYYEMSEKMASSPLKNSMEAQVVFAKVCTVYAGIAKQMYANLIENDDTYKHLMWFVNKYQPITKHDTEILLAVLEKHSEKKGHIEKTRRNEEEIDMLLKQYRAGNLQLDYEGNNNAVGYYLAILKSLMMIESYRGEFRITENGKSVL